MLVEQNSKLHMERNYTVSQKHIPSLTGYSFSTSTNFYTFWHVISKDSKISCRYNFLKYIAFTYFIML